MVYRETITSKAIRDLDIIHEHDVSDDDKNDAVNTEDFYAEEVTESKFVCGWPNGEA